MFFRYKENARWFVEGSTDNNGYGLTWDRSPYALYVDANNLLLDGNFLYDGGVSKLIRNKSYYLTSACHLGEP